MACFGKLFVAIGCKSWQAPSLIMLIGYCLIWFWLCTALIVILICLHNTVAIRKALWFKQVFFFFFPGWNRTEAEMCRGVSRATGLPHSLQNHLKALWWAALQQHKELVGLKRALGNFEWVLHNLVKYSKATCLYTWYQNKPVGGTSLLCDDLFKSLSVKHGAKSS